MPSEIYLDHFQFPRNIGEIPEPSALVEVEHEGGGCFDKLRLTLRVNGEGIVEEAMFRARACSGTIAASSAATEWVKGKPLAEAAEVTAQTLIDYLEGIPERKQHSVDLAAEAIRKAAEAAMERAQS